MIDEIRDAELALPYVAPVEEDEASGEVKALFQEIRSYYGFVPRLYRTLAHHPAILRASWEKIRAVMGCGPLSDRCKEAIAVAVSRANDCEYCLRIHGTMLRRNGVSPEEVEAVMQMRLDKTEFLSDREKAIVTFVHKVNRSAPLVGDEDMLGLRQHGVTDGEIVHALGIMDVYVGYNKLLVSLRVQVEDSSSAATLTYPPTR